MLSLDAIKFVCDFAEIPNQTNNRLQIFFGFFRSACVVNFS